MHPSYLSLIFLGYGILSWAIVNADSKIATGSKTSSFSMEHKRYLDEVTRLVRSDFVLWKLVKKATAEELASGDFTKQLHLGSPKIKKRLDELKRRELQRLREATYNDLQEVDEAIVDVEHLEITNPHTFEAEDWKMVFFYGRKALMKLDAQRKAEFKQYELQKEFEFQESLKNMSTEDREHVLQQRKDAQEKHKLHEPINRPGSEKMFEEVWEKKDHLDRGDFNVKTFFHLHDLDGNKLWDMNEFKAILTLELTKIYANDANVDPVEREEELERMREDFFKASDADGDSLEEYKEHMKRQKEEIQQKSEQEWKTFDPVDNPAFTKEDYEKYAADHEKKSNGANRRNGLAG